MAASRVLAFRMRFALVVLAACSGPAAQTSTPARPAQGPITPAPTPTVITSDAMGEHRRALVDVDEANPRAVERAVKAADALGEARHAAAIAELGGLALRPPSKTLVAAQIAALRALGRMSTDKRAASAALANVIARDLPARPVRPDDRYGLHIAALGAAINAIAELEEPSAATMLVPVIYRAPELAMQLRRAFAGSGAVAATEFRKVLRREHAGVEALFRDRMLDKYCGDRGDAQKCEPVSAREFYAAIILGDLRDASAVPDLLAALDRPAVPPYYIDGAAAPNTQHTAIFDALRKIGAPEAAPKLKTIWSNPKVDKDLRLGAIGAYAFTAPDAASAEAIWKIAADNSAPDELRVEAASAYARLARDTKQIAGILKLAKKYTDAAAKKRAAADKLAPAKLTADGELQKARDALDAAKAKLLATTQDQTTTAEQIRAQTEATKKAEADYKAARKTHREKTSVFTMNDTAAKAYVGYARMFQTHVARVEIAARCADNVDCYATALRTTASDAVLQLRASITDVETWSVEEKQGLVQAYVDRAALELGRRKAKLDNVLDAIASEDRVIREALLLALPKLAPAQCPACVAKLDAVIEAGRGKSYLAALQVETQIVRNVLRSR
jgi:hypothetical protein